MKINAVKTIIAVLISALISYGLYRMYDGSHGLLLCLGSFLSLAAMLITTIGATFKQGRTSVNIKVVAGIFFLISLISNLIFSFKNFSESGYIITNGIILLIFVLTTYSIYSARK